MHEQVEEDPTGGKFSGAIGTLNGAPNKLEDVINFHVGDLLTAIQRCTLQPGGQEVLLYSTISGAIGACSEHADAAGVEHATR